MAIFLIDLPPKDMERRLGDALGVYVDAMRYPRGTENQRAAMWLEHIRRRGWQAVAAVEVRPPARKLTPPSDELGDAPLLGVAYGYPGAPGQWWQQQVVPGPATRRLATPGDRAADEQLFRVDRAAHSSPRAGPRAWRSTGPPAAGRSQRRERPALHPGDQRANPTAPGGCTGGWASPTSSAATTSPVTHERSPSWGARCLYRDV